VIARGGMDLVAPPTQAGAMALMVQSRFDC
jgi:hypothetical protein